MFNSSRFQKYGDYDRDSSSFKSPAKKKKYGPIYEDEKKPNMVMEPCEFCSLGPNVCNGTGPKNIIHGLTPREVMDESWIAFMKRGIENGQIKEKTEPITHKKPTNYEEIRFHCKEQGRMACRNCLIGNCNRWNRDEKNQHIYENSYKPWDIQKVTRVIGHWERYQKFISRQAGQSHETASSITQITALEQKVIDLSNKLDRMANIKEQKKKAISKNRRTKTNRIKDQIKKDIQQDTPEKEPVQEELAKDDDKTKNIQAESSIVEKTKELYNNMNASADMASKTTDLVTTSAALVDSTSV